MDDFVNALISKEKSCLIPLEDDIYAPLLGSWSFCRRQLTETGEYQNTYGEWIFSRVLEGKMIQDIFIWPPRSDRNKDIWEGEYGTTVRCYNPENRRWEVTYINGGYVGRFQAVREGNDIIQSCCGDDNVRWVFSDIAENSFSWKDERRNEKGEWFVFEELKLTRK